MRLEHQQASQAAHPVDIRQSTLRRRARRFCALRFFRHTYVTIPFAKSCLPTANSVPRPLSLCGLSSAQQPGYMAHGPALVDARFSPRSRLSRYFFC